MIIFKFLYNYYVTFLNLLLPIESKRLIFLKRSFPVKMQALDYPLIQRTTSECISHPRNRFSNISF